MTFQLFKSMKSQRSKFAALLLAACFGAMVLHGAPLHEHDLDPFHADPDCVPCHVAQTTISLEAESPELPFALKAARWVMQAATVWISQTAQAPSSRSPPAFH